MDASEKKVLAKRKHFQEEDDPTSKKFKAARTNLLDLSDDVLLLIFIHLNSSHLIHLASVCLRLQDIIADDVLWRKIDTFGEPQPPAMLRKMLKYVSHKTRSIRIEGSLHPPVTVLTQSFLKMLTEKCPNVKEFFLKKCHIDCAKIDLSNFPPTISKLAFERCELVNIETLSRKSYFTQLDETLPKLEALDLTHCRWLSNHSLQSLGKSRTLLDLNLRGCVQIGETFVYTAMATRFGFRNLTKLDLRDTFVGDSEVPCFGRLPKLTHLYFGKSQESDSIENGPQPANFESSGRISDRGVISMCLSEESDRRSVLKVLAFIKTEITDRSLGKLAAVYPLETLDLTGCKHISQEALDGYKVSRPTCKLVY